MLQQEFKFILKRQKMTEKILGCEKDFFLTLNFASGPAN